MLSVAVPRSIVTRATPKAMLTTILAIPIQIRMRNKGIDVGNIVDIHIYASSGSLGVRMF